MTDQLTHSQQAQLANRLEARINTWCSYLGCVATVSTHGLHSFMVQILLIDSTILASEKLLECAINKTKRYLIESHNMEIYHNMNDLSNTFLASIDDKVIPGFEPFDQTNIELPDCLDTYLDSDDGTW